MEIVELLAKLTAVRSESGNERAIADYIQEWLQANTRSIVTRHGDNVLAFVKGRASEKCLVFNGHIDTVKIDGASAWQTDPLTLTEKDNKLYGLGSSDMKGADAAMMKMLQDLDADKPPCDIYCMFVTEEETTGRGTNDSLQYLKPKLAPYKDVAAVIGESTRLGVVLGHRGNAFVKVVFTGKGGHASRPPSQEDQAIHKAQAFIASVADKQLTLGEAYGDDLLGKPGITLTGFEAGTGAMNQIPTMATVTLDIRTVPSFHPKLKPEIQTWAAAFDGQAEILYPCPAGYCSPNERIAQVAMELAGQQDVEVTQGATDQQFFTQAGIPAVICGPGNKAIIHGPNEYVEKDLLEQCAKRYLEIIKSWAD